MGMLQEISECFAIFVFSSIERDDDVIVGAVRVLYFLAYSRYIMNKNLLGLLGGSFVVTFNVLSLLILFRKNQIDDYSRLKPGIVRVSLNVSMLYSLIQSHTKHNVMLIVVRLLFLLTFVSLMLFEQEYNYTFIS